MNDKLKQLPPDLFSEETSWNFHAVIEWFSTHRNVFIYGVSILILVLLAFAKVISWHNSNAEKDYLEADGLFAQFQKEGLSTADQETAHKDLNSLLSLMDRRPDLLPKYQGFLAETLLLNGNYALTEKFMQDIFARTSPDHLKFYQDYSKISLLIAKKEFDKGLEESLKLQTVLDLSQENPVFSKLFIFNTIRLGLLYEVTHNAAEELKIWEQLSSHPEKLTTALSEASQFSSSFSSLKQYIDERKSHLTK